MIKFVLIGVLALAFGAYVLPLMQKDPGYILISVAGYTVELRFWFAVIAGLVLYLLFAFGYKWVKSVFSGIRKKWSQARHRKESKAHSALERGLAYYAMEDYDAAKPLLLKATKIEDTAELGYLYAIKALVQLERFDEAKTLLQSDKAQQAAAGAELDLCKAHIFLKEKNYQACLAELNRLKSAMPKSKAVLSALKDVYWETQDWPALLILCEDMRLAKVLDKSAVETFALKIHQARMLALLEKADVLGEAALDTAFIAELRQAWQEVPSKWHFDESLGRTYAQLLCLTKQDELLLSYCKDYLKQHWSPSMLRLMGQAVPSDLVQHMHLLERWLEQHADDATLQLLIGKLYLHQKTWGQAKTHLQKSLALQPTAEAFFCLGQLAEKVGEIEKQKEWYEKGLAQSLGQPN